MADIFTSDKRSEIMSKIKGKDTKPEVQIRSALHRLGYRYSLHKKTLPGKPDLYFRKYNAVIEINGCFWHGHNCHFFSLPKTRAEFWESKIEANRERDKRNVEKLLDNNIRVLIIWECAISGKKSLPFKDLIDEVEKWLHSDIEFKTIDSKNSNSSDIV